MPHYNIRDKMGRKYGMSRREFLGGLALTGAVLSLTLKSYAESGVYNALTEWGPENPDFSKAPASDQKISEKEKAKHVETISEIGQIAHDNNGYVQLEVEIYEKGDGKERILVFSSDENGGRRTKIIYTSHRLERTKINTRIADSKGVSLYVEGDTFKFEKAKLEGTEVEFEEFGKNEFELLENMLKELKKKYIKD
jgi:hypothetical protein